MKPLSDLVHSFPPVSDTDARVLILGSMPGKASLMADQYYAHPRNAFWKVLSELFGVAISDYVSKKRLLKTHKIALWDVLKSCNRVGSLDSDIEADSMVGNDFLQFYQKHPKITHVYFNGLKAEQSYKKIVMPLLADAGVSLFYQRLPSTSPANAALGFNEKLRAWRVITEVLAG